MPTSDDDLLKKQANVEKLRQQLVTAEASRVNRELELSNDVTAAQLDAEAARLEADLAVAKDLSRVTAVKSGASAPLDTARDLLKAEIARGSALAAAREQRDNIKNHPDASLDPGQRLADATAEANAKLPAGVPAETRIPVPDSPATTTTPKSTNTSKEA